MQSRLRSRLLRYGIALLLTLSLLIGAVLVCCDQLVVHTAQGHLYEGIDELPNSEVGLLLGTSPIVRITRRKNAFFIHRIEAAEALYRAGKVKRFLISGDAHSLDGINEVEAMRDSLLARGIPEEVISLDGAGVRTDASIRNAREVYGLGGFVLISQRFHNERSIYLALHYGFDKGQVCAYNAESPQSARAQITYAREYLARVKMFWDLYCAP